MVRVKMCIWFIMIFIAMIQNHGKLEVLAFEIMLYYLIKISCKKLFSTKEVKFKKRYKYEDDIISANFDNKQQEEEIIDKEYLKYMVNIAADENQKFKERIASYDFREFNNRRNVPWKDVYDYLWYHCRYKGIMMWTEYLNELIKKGVIDENDKKLIFMKAGKYIPWEPRLDLEAEMNLSREKIRQSDREHDVEAERSDRFRKRLHDEGVLNDEQYKWFADRSYKPSLDYLKIFYYDKYLQERGFI